MSSPIFGEVVNFSLSYTHTHTHTHTHTQEHTLYERKWKILTTCPSKKLQKIDRKERGDCGVKK